MENNSMYGIETFDTEEVVVLVNADVDTVASEFARLKGAAHSDRDVINKTLKITNPSYLALRLIDSDWTLIVPCTSSPKNHLEKADAKQLSDSLKARAVFFGNSDCASYTEYELFESGTSREWFQCGDNVKFTSQIRDVPPPEDGPGIYDFINEFFQGIKARIPPLSIEMSAGNMNPGKKVNLAEDLDELDEDDIERIDYISVS